MMNLFIAVLVGGSAGNNFSYAGCGSFYSVYSYDESSANPTIDDGLSEVTSIGFGVSNATGTLIIHKFRCNNTFSYRYA